MEITIKGNENEIAALVLELQGRRISKIDLDSFVKDLHEQLYSSMSKTSMRTE